MRRNRLIALLLTCALLAAALPLSASAMSAERTAARLKGTWRGNFHLTLAEGVYFNDRAVLNYVRDPQEGDRLYLSIESSNTAYIPLNKWTVDDDTLTFSYNRDPWKATVTLSFDDANTLTGTYSQYGREYPLEMKRISSVPSDLQHTPLLSYADEEDTYEDWFQALADYQNYSTGTASIPFYYELGDRTHLEPTLKALKADERLAGLETDVQKMQALMELVCETFEHNGDSGMPEQWDVNSLMAHARANEGIECRGLSIILADFCRAYGIPAKSIKCAAADAYSEYCHVVVHAYSRELGQWIMLDPTYCLILHNSNGQYLSLPMLRQALIDGDSLIPNASAGRNKFPLYMAYYREYMTKNTFHFSSATNFSYGSDNTSGNTVYTLTPLGYSYSYAYSRGETPTHDAGAFWAAPVLPEAQDEPEQAS